MTIKLLICLFITLYNLLMHCRQSNNSLLHWFCKGCLVSTVHVTWIRLLSCFLLLSVICRLIYKETDIKFNFKSTVRLFVRFEVSNKENSAVHYLHGKKLSNKKSQP